MTEVALSPFVWADYRLAVLFTVSLPLLLLLWAFIGQVDAVQRVMVIYWKVASLLAITVFLLIAALPLGFITGWIARILIPLSLWFWADLNEDIRDLPPYRPLKLAFTSWRWAITFYCGIGVIFSGLFLRCGVISASALVTEEATCRLWLQPPWGFREYFLGGQSPEFLGFLGGAGLAVYTVYFVYFMVIRLARQGRSATR
jgi:hypothetical protein